MRENRLTGDFGEYFVAMHFNRNNFQTDIIDHIGIDLMCYQNEKNVQYGISVKFRNIDNGNNSIRIPTKEIVRCYNAAIRRGAVPCYAFGVISKEIIAFRTITLNTLLKNHGYIGIEDINNINTDSISENISLKAIYEWKNKSKLDESILSVFYNRIKMET